MLTRSKTNSLPGPPRLPKTPVDTSIRYRYPSEAVSGKRRTGTSGTGNPAHRPRKLSMQDDVAAATRANARNQYGPGNSAMDGMSGSVQQPGQAAIPQPMLDRGGEPSTGKLAEMLEAGQIRQQDDQCIRFNREADLNQSPAFQPPDEVHPNEHGAGSGDAMQVQAPPAADTSGSGLEGTGDSSLLENKGPRLPHEMRPHQPRQAVELPSTASLLKAGRFHSSAPRRSSTEGSFGPSRRRQMRQIAADVACYHAEGAVAIAKA